MKNVSKLSALVLMMAFFATSTFAQVTASATAGAKILTPISITKTVNMNFGNLAVNGDPGTIVLTTSGARTNTGGVTFLSSNSGDISAASFEVTGLADATYSITLPTGATELTGPTNGLLTVDTWTSDPTPTGALNGSGAQTLNVGATLHVPASSPAGVYTSPTPFVVEVNYN